MKVIYNCSNGNRKKHDAENKLSELKLDPGAMELNVEIQKQSPTRKTGVYDSKTRTNVKAVQVSLIPVLNIMISNKLHA